MHNSAHSSFINTHQLLEIAQMFIDRRMEKQTAYIYHAEEILLCNKKKCANNIHNGISESQKTTMLSGTNITQNIIYIYMISLI